MRALLAFGVTLALAAQPTLAQGTGVLDPIEPAGVHPFLNCALFRQADFYSCWRPPHPNDRLVDLTIDPTAFGLPEEVVHVRYVPRAVLGAEATFEKRVVYQGERGWPVTGPVDWMVLSESLRAAFEAIGPFDLYRVWLPSSRSKTQRDTYDHTTHYLLVVEDASRREAAVEVLRGTEGVLHAGPPVRVQLRSARAQGR